RQQCVEADEKTEMAETDAGDTLSADGKFYTGTVLLTKAGDNSFDYRFHASDRVADAVGVPTSDSAVSVTNNPPVLLWTGEANYEGDGVNPDSASGGSNVEFRISYTDVDNEPPTSIQVWMDKNDNGSYDSAELELHDMLAVDGEDVDYRDGKLYSRTLPLLYVVDGFVDYRFYGSEGIDDATGTPTADNPVTVTPVVSGVAPILEWTGETGYSSDGVVPDSGAGGANYTFRVKYTDDNAPAVIQVWIDEDDSSTYEPSEKYTMIEADSGDLTYADGKLYTAKEVVPLVADGTVNYRFYANDGVGDATGVPTSSGTISVVDPIEVPAEYATIQVAIDAASAGNYVLVSDGTYNENINFKGKAITVLSINGAALTAIDANNAGGPVATFDSGETSASVLDGFTLTKGTGISNRGGGLYITGSSPTIKDSVITGHAGFQFGSGGYILSSSSPTITGTTINGNSSQYGGGLFVDSSSTLTLTDSTISNNTATSHYGGGVYLRDSSAAVSNTAITGNAASSNWGGGFYLAGSTTNVTIDNSTIDNNTATYGGGMFVTTNATVTITDSVLNSNSTSADGGAVYANGGAVVNLYGNVISGNQARYGSGVGISLAVLDLGTTTISGNAASGWGGGVYLTGATASATVDNSNIDNNTGSFGGGMFVSTDAVVTVRDSTFNSNSTSADGGGVYANGSATVNFYRSVIGGNQARYGGGVGFTVALVELENTRISGNKASRGGGIYIGSASAVLTTTNSTIGGNYASAYGGGLFADGTVMLTNSIFWGNISSNDNEIYNTVDSANVFNSDIDKDGYEGINGNIRLDPLFVSSIADPEGEVPTASGDYHLLSGSPAIDVGTATGAPTDDIDGDARPYGTGYDMGSDEYVVN
ncbi:MAG: right-handed parallel beta-helix repeat-containing protein, partial [Deltaproteobacteria bacterium]|nr:right-handed parallel beta-helix repeat-containing protein [Deltaproteobacteria bacterium]